MVTALTATRKSPRKASSSGPSKAPAPKKKNTNGNGKVSESSVDSETSTVLVYNSDDDTTYDASRPRKIKIVEPPPAEKEGIDAVAKAQKRGKVDVATIPASKETKAPVKPSLVKKHDSRNPFPAHSWISSSSNQVIPLDGHEGELNFKAGFESPSVSDREDSSDEEDEEGAEKFGGVESLGELTKNPKVRIALEKDRAKKAHQRGVIYIGRLPRGFEEGALKEYFNQFGKVLRVRVSRNKRTGSSKHYAFLEFASSGVAEIAAETMDNYLLCGHLLQCKMVPKEDVHPDLWKGTRKFRVTKAYEVAARHNAKKSLAKKRGISKRLLDRQEKKRADLAAQGIEYTFDGYKPGEALVEEPEEEKEWAGPVTRSRAMSPAKRRLEGVDEEAEGSEKKKQKSDVVNPSAEAPVDVEPAPEAEATAVDGKKKKQTKKGRRRMNLWLPLQLRQRRSLHQQPMKKRQEQRSRRTRGGRVLLLRTERRKRGRQRSGELARRGMS
ncbi:hypothetical protein BT69DRAFT_1292182 [Atractiella rhizophila]|nr:hypothetical protein BT69DRAFT_1292182 [Atractiella rhizophila]